jgi:hypothetical protein
VFVKLDFLIVANRSDLLALLGHFLRLEAVNAIGRTQLPDLAAITPARRTGHLAFIQKNDNRAVVRLRTSVLVAVLGTFSVPLVNSRHVGLLFVHKMNRVVIVLRVAALMRHWWSTVETLRTELPVNRRRPFARIPTS